MKMFGLKSCMAAFALTVLGSQAGATTLVCPDPAPAYAVDRELTLSWDESDYDAGVQCLFSGYDAVKGPGNDAYNYFDNPNDGNDWLTHNGWTQIGSDIGDSTSAASLASLISATKNALDQDTSLYSGVSGSAVISDIYPYGTYAILMKFGAPAVAESWFIFEVTFGDLATFAFDWLVGGQNALSHTSVWGKDPTTTVPLPAGGVLLLTALSGIALVRRRKLVAA